MPGTRAAPRLPRHRRPGWLATAPGARPCASARRRHPVRWYTIYRYAIPDPAEATVLTDIRKTWLHVEKTYIEGGRAAPQPLTLIAAAAVLANPWAGRGFVENLKPEINRVAPPLGELLTAMIVEAAGSGAAVEGYGKSAVVGTDGEVEHASALIHTLRFGNHYREAVGAKSYLSFCNTRGPANAPVMIPLMDKNDAGRRSHYLTIQFAIADAPAPGEIVVALGASIGGRPHHRIGDRYQDLKDLGHDVDNPAAV